MRHRRKVEEGGARAVLAAPAHPDTQALIAAVPRLHATRPQIPNDAAIVLRTERLAKTYGSARSLFRAARRGTVVDHVDIAMRRGETLSVVGESGSGKTTLARLIVRLLRPDEGGIDFHGNDLSHLSRAALRPTDAASRWCSRIRLPQ